MRQVDPKRSSTRGVGSKTLALGNQTQALQLPQSHTSGRTASAWAYQNPQVGADFRVKLTSIWGMSVPFNPGN